MKVKGLLDSVVFGPVDSRRYGVSLGVNLLPAARKICSFDCPYCECGRTESDLSRAPSKETFPPAEDVIQKLAEALERACEAERPIRPIGPIGPIDAITLAGNGEPTLHPEFFAIMKGMAEARDRLAPAARLIALTNGTTLQDGAVRDGLMIADERIVKVDAGDDDMLRRLNSPLRAMTIALLIENIGLLPACATQTMFVRGLVDNSTDESVEQWIAVIGRIQPTYAQVYSIDRRPAHPRIERVPAERLHEIARRLTSRTGVPAKVYR